MAASMSPAEVVCLSPHLIRDTAYPIVIGDCFGALARGMPEEASNNRGVLRMLVENLRLLPTKSPTTNVTHNKGNCPRVFLAMMMSYI